MTLESDAKFEEKLTCGVETDIKNLAKFHQSTIESLKIETLMGSICPKYTICALKIYSGVMCHDNEEWCEIWRGTDLSIQNWHEKFDEFWPEHSKISKSFTLMCCFWPKYIMLELKKYRKNMFDDTEDWCKLWKKSDMCFQKWHEEFGKFLFTGWKIAWSFQKIKWRN